MREMKDGGIEWIGNIPASWKSVPMRYLFRECTTKNRLGQEKTALKFTYGTIIPKTNFDANTDDYVANTIMSYTVVHPGVIMINCLNLNYDFVSQRIGLVKDYGAITSAYLAIEPNNQVLSAYATYQLKSWDAAKAFHNMGIGVRKTLDFSELGKKHFVLPTLGEQKNIVAFLDSKCSEIDAISADIQKEIETLEQYKRSLVFEAISKGINGEKTANTSSDIWKEIPQSWKLVDIKYLFEIVKRIAGREGYNILSVTQKGLKVKDISGNQGQIAENYSGYQFVFPSDYVMNHMDLLTGWIDCSDQFGVTSPDYRVFRLRDKAQNDTEYYKYVMQCCYMCRIFYSLGQGVSTLGRWRLQTSAFMNFKVPVPPLHEQKEIARYLNDKCKEIELSIEQKRKQLELLSAYKKSLIYEYVTGKKEVI